MNSTTVRIIGSFLRMLWTVSPSLAVRVMASLFLRTSRRRLPLREVKWLSEAVPVSVMSDGVPLNAVSWGESTAPVVLLVHGWEGRGSQLGSFVAPLLDEGYRVVAFDAPGHGESPGRRSSLIEMGRAVLATAQTVGGIEAIISHSGGCVVTTYALEKGLEVDRLVYVCPTVDAGKFLYQAAQSMGLDPELPRRTQELIEVRFGISWEEFELVHLAPRRSERLLVIHDREDKVVSFADGQQLADLWEGADFVATQGLGHHRILRHDSVVQRVTDYLLGRESVFPDAA